ncbi:unnamed protein product [Closterium sp. Yama58-4]|nr:unnamed protein product [Closterium sp. Yama58-4]
MGKRKSAAKPEARKVQKVPTTFNCPFCNHEASVECKLDKKAGIGTVSCRVCAEQYQTTIDNSRYLVLLPLACLYAAYTWTQATIPHVPSINLSQSETLTMTDVSSALREQQKLLQSTRKLVHMKLPGDRITSVVIPSVLALTATALIGRGLFNMSFGIGKKE